MGRKLFVIDLDGTLVTDCDEFYEITYGKLMLDFVEEKKGEEGLAMMVKLREMRGTFNDLALVAMGIPFAEWEKRMYEKAPFELIVANRARVDAIRSLKGNKVVYTGTPTRIAKLLLSRIGFDPMIDFDMILGWEESTVIPVKWTHEWRIFSYFAHIFKDCDRLIAIGDSFRSDIRPADTAFFTTVYVGKRETVDCDYKFNTIEEFIEFHNNEEGCLC